MIARKDSSTKKEGEPKTGRSRERVAGSRSKAQRRTGVAQKREGSAAGTRTRTRIEQKANSAHR